MALFEAHGLHKRFGAQVVLERIDLAFEAGRASGIMGPNGAGKTTCFNVLTGLYKPDRGRILFDGRDITGIGPAAVARCGISRSFQLMNLFDDFTAAEHVAFGRPRTRQRAAHGFASVAADGEARDRAHEILASVGLGGRGDTNAKDLSYGQRRALEIAVALAADPAMLFLDEPTAGLGTEGTARLLDLLEDLKQRYTLVIIEHDMRFLFRIADRVSVIHWGQVIAEGTPEELMRDPWVRASDLSAVA